MSPGHREGEAATPLPALMVWVFPHTAVPALFAPSGGVVVVCLAWVFLLCRFFFFSLRLGVGGAVTTRYL